MLHLVHFTNQSMFGQRLCKVQSETTCRNKSRPSLTSAGLLRSICIVLLASWKRSLQSTAFLTHIHSPHTAQALTLTNSLWTSSAGVLTALQEQRHSMLACTGMHSISATDAFNNSWTKPCICSLEYAMHTFLYVCLLRQESPALADVTVPSQPPQAQQLLT